MVGGGWVGEQGKGGKILVAFKSWTERNILLPYLTHEGGECKYKQIGRSLKEPEKCSIESPWVRFEMDFQRVWRVWRVEKFPKISQTRPTEDSNSLRVTRMRKEA